MQYTVLSVKVFLMIQPYLHVEVDVWVEDGHGCGLEEEDELDPDEVAEREVVADPPHHRERLVRRARQAPVRRRGGLQEVLHPATVALSWGW